MKYIVLIFICSTGFAQKKDSVILIPENTKIRLEQIRETQKQLQQEFESTLKTLVEGKNFSLEEIDWQRTILLLPDRKLLVATIPKPKK